MFRKLKEQVLTTGTGGSPRRLSVVALLALTVCGGATAADSALAAAVAREDWPGVLSAAPGSGAAEQYLRAHALLALNNSGAAMCAIASASSPEAVRAWDNWTGSFVSTHNTAVARYLRGDSLARAEHYGDAMEQFASALRIRPNFSLALNARGVLLAGRGEYDRALLDFVAASRANPDFADAYMNKGFYYVQTRQSAAGARGGFSKALALSPGSGLARMGLALLDLVSGDPSRADEGLSAAVRECPCLLALIPADRTRVVQWVAQRAVGRTLTAREAGTEINRLMQAGMKDSDPASITQAMKLAGGDKDLQSRIKKIEESYMQQQPAKAKDVLAKAANDFTKYIDDETVRLQKLQTKESKVSATLGADGKKFGLAAGGGVTAESTIKDSVVAKEALKKLEPVSQFASDQKKTYDPTNKFANGVRSDDIAYALVDRGDWPLIPHYALSYAVSRPSPTTGR